MNDLALFLTPTRSFFISLYSCSLHFPFFFLSSPLLTSRALLPLPFFSLEHIISTLAESPQDLFTTYLPLSLSFVSLTLAYSFTPSLPFTFLYILCHHISPNIPFLPSTITLLPIPFPLLLTPLTFNNLHLLSRITHFTPTILFSRLKQNPDRAITTNTKNDNNHPFPSCHLFAYNTSLFTPTLLDLIPHTPIFLCIDPQIELTTVTNTSTVNAQPPTLRGKCIRRRPIRKVSYQSNCRRLLETRSGTLDANIRMTYGSKGRAMTR
ncbi:hypothetical protein BKA57DRAFT_57286 [Linnemannia elongata]|nr:hypothetical protein BKA57DRAFT_57286 [Linnemannia elongata]